MLLVKGSKLEHKCIVDHRSGRGSHDPDHLVADHGNRTRLGGKRYGSVDELHDFSHHFRIGSWFCTHRPTSVVPERETFVGLTGPTVLAMTHPAASQPGVTRNKGSLN